MLPEPDELKEHGNAVPGVPRYRQENIRCFNTLRASFCHSLSHAFMTLTPPDGTSSYIT